MCTKTRGTHARTRRAQPEARVLSSCPKSHTEAHAATWPRFSEPEADSVLDQVVGFAALRRLPRSLSPTCEATSSLGARPSIGVLSRTGSCASSSRRETDRRWPPSLTDLDKEIGHLTPVPCGLRAVFCCPTCKLQQAGQQEGNLLCCGHLKLNDSACLPDASHLTPWRS